MEKTDNSFRMKLLSSFLRLILSFAVSILFFYLVSPVFIAGHLKLFQNQLELLHPEYEIVNKEIVKINQLDYIQFYIKVNKHPKVTDTPVKKGTILKVKGQASTLCVAPIIIFSLILAWPGLAVRKRLKAFMVAFPLMILLAVVDYPLIFISDIESVYTDAPVMNGIRSLWRHLINNGGRQFLGVGIALASLALAGLDFRKKKIESIGKVGRNGPCPCGSGKKYKNCCLK